MNRIILSILFLGFSLFSQTALAEVSFMVFGSRTPLNYGGKAEELGGITITAQTAGVSSTDTIRFHFIGVAISNPFSGNIPVDPATGLAAAPGGITLSTSGGWRNSAVNISLQTSALGDSVTLSFPAGLTIAVSDWISLNGVRADVSLLPIGAQINIQIFSITSTLNATNLTLGIIAPSLTIMASPGYAIGCRLIGPAPQVVIQEGFLDSFVQNVPAPVNPRLLFGATGNTQIHLVVSNLPGGAQLVWPSLVAESISSLVKLEQTALGDQVIYEYRTNDQAMSDQVRESFSIQPSLRWDSIVYKGTAVIQAHLYPSASSEAIPRFDSPLEPVYGLEFLTVGYTPADDANPPQVQIIAPADGSSIYGDLLASAFALDDVGVVGVQFYLDEVALGNECTVLPFSTTIPASSLSVGSHALVARARDRGGHTSLSETIHFNQVSSVHLDSISPVSGPASGGTLVTLTGSEFKEGAILLINGSPAAISQLTRESVTATTGATAHSGNSDVVLTNLDGGQAHLSSAFHYTTPIPILDQITPNSRMAYDLPFQLMVSGNQFTQGTQVTWNGSSRVTRFLNSQQLEATITTADLSTVGIVEVGVVTEGTAAAGTKSFTISPISGDPTYLNLLPVSGSSSGNEKISLLGSGFKPELIPSGLANGVALADRQFSITLGGKPLAQLTFVNQGQIDARTPKGVAGNADLVIQDCCGMKSIPNAYSYKILATLATRWNSHSTPATRLWIPLAADTFQNRTNLGLNNPRNTPATVTIQLINPAGEILAEKSTPVPAHGLVQINHILRFMENQEILTGREGYLLLESENDIKAWASLVDNFSNDPVILKAYSSADADEHLIIPSSADSQDYKTELLIVNATATQGFVNIRSYSSNGELQASLENLSMGPNGWIHLEDFYRQAGVSNRFGPLEIEASPGVKLVGGARIFTPQKTGGYLEGIAARLAGGVIKIPRSIDTVDSRTNLGITNAGSSLAAVTVTLRDEHGLIRGSRNIQVPPHGMVQLNHVNRILLNQYSRTNTLGSLSLSSFQPIIGWVSEIDNRTQDLSFSVSGQYSLQTRILLPSVTKTGEFRSALTISNAGIQPTQVRITVYNPQGSYLLSRIVNVSAGGQFSRDDIFSFLGFSDTYGPLELESLQGQPILVTSRVTSSQSTSGVLDGQPFE